MTPKHRTGLPGPGPRPGSEARSAGRARRWGAHLLGLFASSLLGLLHRSWKTEVDGLKNLENLLRRGERVLVVFWHGKYIPFFTILQGRKGCIFASRSFRGEVIADICRRFGYHCLTIPDRAGQGAAALMREVLAGEQLAAVVPDGPLGPYHEVKPGVVRLAADLGMTLLPASAAARPRIVLARRWDRMEIPRPFSRVRLRIGRPIVVPPDLGGHPVRWWEQQVGKALEAAGEQAEAGLDRE